MGTGRPTDFACLQSDAFSVLAPIMFYNTDLQKELENNLVAIQFRLTFSLERPLRLLNFTLLRQFSALLFQTVLVRVCVWWIAGISSGEISGHWPGAGAITRGGAERTNKCHFSWQLLTGNCLKSLHFGGNAFFDLYFLIASGLHLGEKQFLLTIFFFFWFQSYETKGYCYKGTIASSGWNKLLWRHYGFMRLMFPSNGLCFFSII